MVYKHAISTIVPGRAVNFSATENDDNAAWSRGARRQPRRAFSLFL